MGKRNKSGSRRPKNVAAKPWEPTPEQMAIYAEAIRGLKTQAQIGKEQVPPIRQQSVNEIIRRIDTWLAPQLMDSIREIKAEHTSRLMHLYSEAMKAWEASKLPAVKLMSKETAATMHDSGGVKRSRSKEFPTGDASYLSEARACLADIRKIWGADAPIKSELSIGAEIRVAGLSREEAIRQEMARLGDSLKVIEVRAETPEGET